MNVKNSLSLLLEKTISRYFISSALILCKFNLLIDTGPNIKFPMNRRKPSIRTILLSQIGSKIVCFKLSRSIGKVPECVLFSLLVCDGYAMHSMHSNFFNHLVSKAKYK